jgi:membrane protein implicated in regulation of membrane protease activity
VGIYNLILSPWFWLGLVIIFSLIELACALNLITIWFAASALIMVFVPEATKGFSVPVRFNLHIIIFLLIAAALLIFTRPLVIKKLKIGKTKTNVDDLINRTALVTKSISKFSPGEIKVNGQIWTAISENNDLEQGTECTVVEIVGVKAIVKK